jgi:hypothetical protein
MLRSVPQVGVYGTIAYRDKKLSVSLCVLRRFTKQLLSLTVNNQLPSSQPHGKTLATFKTNQNEKHNETTSTFSFLFDLE